jgi:hypothetical protein
LDREKSRHAMDFIISESAPLYQPSSIPQDQVHDSPKGDSRGPFGEPGLGVVVPAGTDDVEVGAKAGIIGDGGAGEDVKKKKK